MPYKERLKELKLPTLKYRRIRGDMIEMYKILTNRYDAQVTLKTHMCNDKRTRGNSLKLKTERCKYDLRKYFFSCRITNTWNSLPDNVVSAASLNSFKNRLDNYWKNKEVYHYECDI